ncbi:hypothetical protein ACHAWF_017064 [Thalassiosira exigua]
MRLDLLNVAVALVATGGRAAGFSAPPARTRPARRGGTVVPNQSELVATSAAATMKRGPSSTRSNAQTSLEAIPPSAAYALGHIIGGTSSAPFVIRAIDSWYKRLPLPSWTPPNFIFSPVWTLLYGTMGVSVSRIVKSASPSAGIATKLWIVHCALNLAWAPIFFGMKRLRLGLVVNLFLVATLGVALPLFRSIDPVAAYLLVPYFLWLIFATKLNQAICKLNPTVDGVNRAMLLADVDADGEGDGYSDDMLQYDIKLLQAAAAKYAGL